jgi:hypothetical protein
MRAIMDDCGLTLAPPREIPHTADWVGLPGGPHLSEPRDGWT